jgi:hypothetical protein
MSTTPSAAKQHLASENDAALVEGASAQDVVELISRPGDPFTCWTRRSDTI